MSTTFAERLATGLVLLGWTERKSRSRYREFEKPGNFLKLFVGPEGALRSGAFASLSHSIGQPSNQTAFYRHVLLAASGEPLRGEP